MKARSARFVFTGLMSGLSAVFGGGLMAIRYGYQSDSLTDVLKTSVFMAVCCCGLAFTFWTILHRRGGCAPWRGAVSGALTALCLIPLPFFASTLKDGVLAAYRSGEAGLASAILHSVPAAIETGYLTFVYLTKASLCAVILSAALGYGVARWVRVPRAETSQIQY